MVSSMLHSLSEVPRIAKFRPIFSPYRRGQKERISMSKALSPEVRVPYALVARWASPPPGCSLRHWVVRRFVVLRLPRLRLIRCPPPPFEAEVVNVLCCHWLHSSIVLMEDVLQKRKRECVPIRWLEHVLFFFCGRNLKKKG